MLHVKFEIHGCSALREQVILMLVSAYIVYIDGRAENWTLCRTLLMQVRQELG